MKMSVKKDTLILKPETEKDFYHLGVLSRIITHESVWSIGSLGGGEFIPREMKIQLDTLILTLIGIPMKEGK